MSCTYNKSNTCLLNLKTCKKSNEDSIKKCNTLKSLKENKPSEKIYDVREDVICKKCGGHVAYKYLGTLYPYGLPKSKIDKMPEINGKYYNSPKLFNAVGFGGTIPYKCASCGEHGLIGMNLECYENLFDINEIKEEE